MQSQSFMILTLLEPEWIQIQSPSLEILYLLGLNWMRVFKFTFHQVWVGVISKKVPER